MIVDREKNLALGAYLGATVFVLDQLTKWLVLSFVMKPPRVVPVTSWFNLVLSWNKGVTFGILNHAGLSDVVRSWGLVVVALLIIALLFRWLLQASTLWATLGLGLVMGGASGNVVDRARFGAVTDFLDFHLGSWHWYAFNLADSAIVLGVVLLGIDHLVMTRKKR
jgi:signal peptidase II